MEKSLEEDHAHIYGEKSVWVIEIPLCTVFHQRHLGGYPFWDVVFNLEKCGFKVIVATADGASPNRAFPRIHFPTSKNNHDYKTNNPFTTEERYIYFFSDPPHLLKMIRNCLANANRTLWVRLIWYTLHE